MSYSAQYQKRPQSIPSISADEMTPVEKSSIGFDRSPSRNGAPLHSNDEHTWNGDEEKARPDGENDDDKERDLRRVRTLGEGPLAPDAAAESASAAVDVDNEGYIDPGLKGWMSLLGAVLVNSLCYGMTNSFGVFQEYYTSTHSPTVSAGATAVSWIGSIQFCLCPLLGCIAGPLFDAGYLKSLVGIGGGLYVFCLMMTSIATQYYQILLAHGIGVGLGMGLIFSPSVSTLSHHFGRSRYRTFAYGCQAAGSALAGIIYPVILRQLFPAVGFGWAMRILALIVLIIVIGAFFALSRKHPPRKELALLSPVVFRNRAYTIYVIGGSLGSLAIYSPVTFGATYMTAKGWDPGLAFYAVAVGNGCSIFGRIAPLIIAQRFGTINMMTLAACISGIILFMWTLTNTPAAFLTYEAFYGVTSGAYGATFNPGAASFAPEANQSGLYLGMAFFTASFFWLAGTPATAALIKGKTEYLPASIFCGCAVLGSAAFLFCSRMIRVKQVGSKWI